MSFLGIGSGVDEDAERQRFYNEAKNKFPIDAKISTCESLLATAKNVQLVIDGALQTKASSDTKANQRVQNRIIDGYTWWLNDVKAMYNTKQCDDVIMKEDQEEYLDSQYSQLERVKGLSAKTSNTTKYLIIGMLVVVVGVAGVILYKEN
jgi:hypothetical protein